jgi:hypothetical protein
MRACGCLIALVLLAVLGFVLLNGCDRPAANPFLKPPVVPYVPQTPAYLRVTLHCGCTLRIRSNTDCCGRYYPDLGRALENLKALVLSSEREPNEPLNDDPKRTADGDYVTVRLKCGCSISVYVPETCPCFNQQNNPKLAAALERVYQAALSHRKLP